MIITAPTSSPSGRFFMKPARFSPYDLSTVTYTGLLWVFEGITSYYDDLLLLRAGLISEQSYLELLGRTVTRLLRARGRFRWPRRRVARRPMEPRQWRCHSRAIAYGFLEDPQLTNCRANGKLGGILVPFGGRCGLLTIDRLAREAAHLVLAAAAAGAEVVPS